MKLLLAEDEKALSEVLVTVLEKNKTSAAKQCANVTKNMHLAQK